MIRCYLRVSRDGSTLRRPHGFWPGPCIESLFASLVYSRTQTHCTVIVPDTSTAQLVATLIPHDLPHSLVVSGVYGNSESFYYSLVLALDESAPSDIIYMVEDDYIHMGPIADFLADGIGVNPTGYVTLYDDPLHYFKSEDVRPLRYETTLHIGHLRHWCVSPSTTMTFATTAWVIRRDWRIHCSNLVLGNKPRDRAIWETLASQGHTLIRGIPGAASHVELTASGLFGKNYSSTSMNLQSISDWSTIRSTARTPIIMCSRALSCATLRTVESFAHVMKWRDDNDVLNMIDYVVLTAGEKDAFDARLRARAHSVRAVFIEGMELGARLYGGRDYPIEMLHVLHQ